MTSARQVAEELARGIERPHCVAFIEKALRKFMAEWVSAALDKWESHHGNQSPRACIAWLEAEAKELTDD